MVILFSISFSFIYSFFYFIYSILFYILYFIYFIYLLLYLIIYWSYFLFLILIISILPLLDIKKKFPLIFYYSFQWDLKIFMLILAFNLSHGFHVMPKISKSIWKIGLHLHQIMIRFQVLRLLFNYKHVSEIIIPYFPKHIVSRRNSIPHDQKIYEMLVFFYFLLYAWIWLQ